ncbi:LamG domain-containing protein [Patescibacteria group bacterium]
MRKTFWIFGLILLVPLFLATGCQEQKRDTSETSNTTQSPIESDEPGLVAHWEFEDDGSIVKDSADSYDGTIVGGAEYVPGKSGNALSFNGTDGRVDFPKSVVDGIGGLEQGTIAFWFKYDSLLDTQQVEPIFFIGNDENDNQDDLYVIELGHSSFDGAGSQPDPENRKLYSTWIKDNREPFLCYDSRVNLEEDTWYHFAVVVDSEGNTGYLNGQEMDNRYYNFGEASDSFFLADVPDKQIMNLGYGRNSKMISPDFVYFKGLLDDFRIYDRPLTAEEIQELI